MQPTAARRRRATPIALGIAALLLSAAAPRRAAAAVTVERHGGRVAVRVDGRPFAEYHARSGHLPVIWPIYGPTDQPMTRSFPVGPLRAGEKGDHPHHRSLWFAHQWVNGLDFWHAPRRKDSGVIDHRGFVSVGADGDRATIVTRNLWQDAARERVVCEDERTVVFGADAAARWIDFTITVHASNGPVRFGDIKDGAFGVRVAGRLKADAGGTLINSAGRRNADAWGLPADWIDNYGRLGDGEDEPIVGLAMFSHPSNFRHPTRWHARTYGLLTANPFGEQGFPPVAARQSAHQIAAGGSMTLRYRVYLHRGTTEEADIAGVYRRYASE